MSAENPGRHVHVEDKEQKCCQGRCFYDNAHCSSTLIAQDQDVSETNENMESKKAVRVIVTMTMLNSFCASCGKRKGWIPGGHGEQKGPQIQNVPSDYV